MIDSEQKDLFIRAGEVYRPSAPITHRDLFSGRIEQLSALVDSMATVGQHAIVYGERGVGKTSLVSILPSITWGPDPAPTFRNNCHSGDTFARIWRRALDGLAFEVERPSPTFTNQTKTEVHCAAQRLSNEPTPDEVVSTLRAVNVPVVFVFDEFDQITDKTVSAAMAEVMKALSDYAASAKIVLVGLGDTVDHLITSHASIERAARQIRMPRMTQPELAEIIDKASEKLGMECQRAARNRIVRLSQGLPHYVHSLGLNATRAAISTKSSIITMMAVEQGIKKAIDNASQSLLDMYLKAISSPQKDSLYKYVLLACALAKTDEVSCFTPAAVRTPLKAIERPLEIPAFASHLTKFASADRGNVLKKIGTSRRFRYGFTNPLLQPFVVMRGITDGLVASETVDQLLAANAAAAPGQLALGSLDGIGG